MKILKGDELMVDNPKQVINRIKRVTTRFERIK